MTTVSDNIIYGGDYVETLQYATLGELLYKNFTEGGEKTSLINGVTGEKWTFRALREHSTRMARVLYGAGIRQNDVVTILSESRHEYSSISFGTIFLNAIVAPTNYSYTERELKHTLDISRPKFVFVAKKFSENVLPVARKLNFIQKIIILDDESGDEGKEISFNAFVRKFENANFDVEKFIRKPVKLDEQGAIIFMSSGTTGLPKGCELSHSNVIACIANSLERIPLLNSAFPNYIPLIVSPWFHAMGFMAMTLLAASREFTTIFLWKFEPRLYLECIQKYKVVSLPVPPPIVVFLAKTPLFDQYDLSSVKVILSGAAPLTQEIEEQVKKRFNDKIVVLQGYGQTEATLGVINANVATVKAGSVGRINKGLYGKVIDEKGQALGANKVGELCFKGPMIMKGYYSNDEATAETIDEDRWLHTGDLGYYDDEYNFFIVDRIKELIKYKGYQVAPAELEGLLLSYPKVKDVGVIGIFDEKSGELPMAFIVKQNNVDVTERELVDFVAKNTSDSKWLRGGVKFIDEIPKNPSGKILRRELRDFYKRTKSKL